MASPQIKTTCTPDRTSHCISAGSSTVQTNTLSGRRRFSDILTLLPTALLKAESPFKATRGAPRFTQQPQFRAAYTRGRKKEKKPFFHFRKIRSEEGKVLSPHPANATFAFEFETFLSAESLLHEVRRAGKRHFFLQITFLEKSDLSKGRKKTSARAT